ncbi:Fip1 motif-domain-containing protein [Achaetomium macrosporum]|uniref:Fip1 motif-domain-containing protein n=1 Tax=Achaetomium macrosporum TaxID=79813 RepID=A0AAN7H7I1_9PEZI|nr:Fip1 motif-domain-containing protein [Achaetomium macrosporum]
MDIDDEDDFYAPEEPQAPAAQPEAPATAPKKEPNEELEEGEEEDEGGAMDEDDDSDIDIITERKDGSKPPPQSRYSEIKNIPQRSASSETATIKPPQIKRESPRQQSATTTTPADAPPPMSTSKIDVNAIPIHKPTNKPLTQVNIDEDLPDNDKPWRKPGTDLSDYFNYGFDEFTWALYAQKQEALRGEYNPEAIAQSNKKMMEDMTNMMMMGGMPPLAPGGMPGAGGAGGAGPGGAGPGGQGGMLPPGMEGLSPEIQAMMQQMMASGMDPSQMDMGAMAGMFGGGGAPGGAGQGGQGQGFGGGFGGGQGQGYGYDQQMGGGGGGGRGGRGRGRRW